MRLPFDSNRAAGRARVYDGFPLASDLGERSYPAPTPGRPGASTSERSAPEAATSGADVSASRIEHVPAVSHPADMALLAGAPRRRAAPGDQADVPLEPVDHPAPGCEGTLDDQPQARHGPLEIQIDQHQEEWSVELRGELDFGTPRPRVHSSSTATGGSSSTSVAWSSSIRRDRAVVRARAGAPSRCEYAGLGRSSAFQICGSRRLPVSADAWNRSRSRTRRPSALSGSWSSACRRPRL